MEPTSMKASTSKLNVDRVSVTFADDVEEVVPRRRSSRVSIMENMPLPNETAAAQDSDEEDYSASVNAIIQRRASTRRSKRRRDSRRASSPYTPDVLPSTENDRRRSSAFTTSSGDTAITVEDSVQAATQEQIFENIKIHKEVLQYVKMQPWDMRKKLKLVIQAKAYIKKHEGALQERLAHSGSTKDRLARFYIYFLKNWQKFRRELNNTSNWFMPWEQKIKEIESHFGSVVASYFLFLRWLFWVNIVIAGILLCFVTVPEICFVSMNYIVLTVKMTKFMILLCVCSTTYEVLALKDLEPEFEDKKFNQSMVENSVHFYLYHSSNFGIADELVAGDEDLLNRSRYNADLPTTILIHGWTHGRNTPWMVEMREAMANKSIWNIIIVDWAPLARTLYTEARVHSPTVARIVGNLCLFLNKRRGLRMSDMHFIGHSMGAQISAMTSAYIRQHLSEKIGRITGLDPAAPLYEWPHMESSDEVIDPSDAVFVDVIHTNGNYLGMISPCGHVDYYPNGGMHQPGCTFWLCSHMRAVEFWTASIKNPDVFKAYPFSIWNKYVRGEVDGYRSYPMGISADPRIPRGVYFLETVDEVQYIHTKTTMMDSL